MILFVTNGWADHRRRDRVWQQVAWTIFELVMGHQKMLNPELEDHTGGDLGFLNSLSNRLFGFGQEPTPDIRNNIYLRSFGLAAFFGDTLVTITLSNVACTCVYYIVADWLILNTLDAKAIVLRRIWSKKEYFENIARDLNKILLERGYKNKLTKESIMWARLITKEALTAKTINRVTNRVPLVLTYNPAVPKLRKNCRPISASLLHTSSRCKEIFSSPPLIAYRRRRYMTQILTGKRLRSSSHDTPVQRPLPTLPASTTTECDICSRLFNTNRALHIHR